ncbi:Unknown protein, partial [Striga hermonthica]
ISSAHDTSGSTTSSKCSDSSSLLSSSSSSSSPTLSLPLGSLKSSIKLSPNPYSTSTFESILSSSIIESKPETPSTDEDFGVPKKKDSLALFTLQMAMTESLFPRISGAQTSKEAWDTLKEEYQGSDKVRHLKLQTLRRDLENMKMKKSEIVKDYYTRLREVVNQIKAFGENITDKRVVEKILITLSAKYDPIVTTTEETKDLDHLSGTELIGSLEAYEKRLSMRENDTIENAFQSKLNLQSQNFKIGGRRFGENNKNKNQGRNNNNQQKGKYPPCGVCKKTNHLEKDCWYRDKPQCKNCGKSGHVEKNCRAKGYQVNFSEENEKGENLLFYANYVTSEEKNDIWFLDSSCSNHMTGDEKKFKNIDGSVKSQVRLGNGDLVEVEGKGSIEVETQKGTRLVEDVLLVPKLDTNLLIVGQMVERGYTLLFKDNSCTIYDNK